MKIHLKYKMKTSHTAPVPFAQAQQPFAKQNDEDDDLQSRRIGDLELRLAQRTRMLHEVTEALATEIRRREEIQTALIAAKLQESFGCLAAGLTHDVNNVLGAISMGYQLLEIQPDASCVQRVLTNGHRAIGQAQGLVENLLDFMNRRAGPAERIVPSGWLPGLDMLLAHASGHHIAWSLRIAPDSWPVQAVKHRLSTALLHLITNAREATHDTGEITVAACNLPCGEARPQKVPEGDFVVFSVTDTGCGMSADMLRQTATPLFTTKAPGQGAGLGLQMVRRFAHDTAGYLHIASQSGTGTQVKLYLPRCEDSAALAVPPTNVPP